MAQPQTQPEALTVAEAAAMQRASNQTVRRMIRTGALHGIKPGGDKLGWRIALADVQRLLGQRPQRS